ncbi:MAG TPA: amidohydrolase family protein [Pyrinomonadaceae bacterium]|nr:amidohydrolase family protein [Pyrinomonadaceae bacterium]
MKSTLLVAVFLILTASTSVGQTKNKRIERNNFKVIDVHMHASTPEFFKKAALANFGAHRKTANRMVTDPSILLKQTIEYMNKNNVQLGLLSGNNDLVQSWVTAHPNRFIPSFSPDTSIKDHRTAAIQFAREIEQGKWRAMGELGLAYDGLALNDPALFPYYEVCERKGIPVFFHTGLDGPEPQQLVSPKFKIELGDPLLLQDVVIRFPKLKVVIMHMGWPYPDHAIYMLYAYPNVYLDTAVVNWILGPSVFNRMLKEAVETVGSDRILFGSDQMVWPQMITPAVQAITRADYLTAGDKRRILWENAASLLKVP